MKSQLNTSVFAIMCLLMLPVVTSAQLPTPTYGTNLGNTLEPPCGEGCWGPPASQALINAIADAGFNTVRIPCAWNSHANQTTYVIDPTFMARVKQVVDWCLATNLYVIINDHWDGGWLENNIGTSVDPTINAKMNSYWTQIATTFAGYNNHLLFAGANEPNVSTAAQMSTLTTYYNTFISAVRITGGNNTSRWLVVQGPNTDIDTTYNLMNTLPTDSATGRLMVEVHYYSPYNFVMMTADETWGNQFFYWGQGYHSTTDTAHNPTWGEEAYMDAEFQKMTTKFVNNGVPVLIGEFGAMKRTSQLSGADLDLHLRARTYYHKTVVDYANSHGLHPCYWDITGAGNFNWTTGAEVDSDNINALTGGAALPPSGSTPPLAPTGLMATVISSNQINLSWTASNGADSYIVKRSTTSGSGYTTIASGVTATSYLNAGLVNGTTYYYVVAATNAYGIGADSAEVGATLTDIRALYAFENNAQDSSGNGNHGTANALSYVAGKVGTQAAQFNGSSSYVLIPRSIENDFTVALWLKTTDTAGSAGAQWWSGKGLVDGEVAGGGADWGTAIVNGKFALGVGSSGGDTTIASSLNINDGTWHHVAATRNNTSGAMQVYVDGVLRGSGTGPTGSRTFPPSLRIGSLQTANNYLNGTLDDVRLYNRVLTAGEIAALMGTPPAAPTGLTATAGSGSVALSWSASATATNYYVKRSTTSGTGYTTIATNASLAFTDIGLNSGTTYYYVVSAVNASGESTNSSEASATPLSEFQSWQLTYFGSTNCASCAGGADFDGDGVSNTNEFLAGTDPTDSASAFRILSIMATGNDVVVTWQAGVGKTNALQAGTLTNYTDVSGPIAITVTPTNATEFGGATNAGPWFYRIRLIP